MKFDSQKTCTACAYPFAKTNAEGICENCFDELVSQGAIPLEELDPFVGRNSQGTLYAETPCWSLLAMPVPELLSAETQERRRYERLHRRA